MDLVKIKIAKDYWYNKTSKLVNKNVKLSEYSSVEPILIDKNKTYYFKKITNEDKVAELTVLISIFNALIQRYFDGSKALSSRTFLSSVNTLLFYDFQVIEKKTIKEIIQDAKEEIKSVYKYAYYFDNPLLEQDSRIKNIPFHFNYGEEDNGNNFYGGFTINVVKLKNKDLKITLNYSAELVDHSLANHFLINYVQWIENLEYNINVSAIKIPLISKEEENKLLQVQSISEYVKEFTLTLAEIVENQVQNTPNEIAVICEDKILTYRDVNVKANQLSHFLLEKFDISKGDLIGIKMERNEYLLISILSVLKIGAAYVPIDINYPEDRITYIENDSNCKIVIDSDFLRVFQESKKTYSLNNPIIERKSDDLAYIIYTSGTTGNPKGVMITNRNALVLLEWAKKEFNSENFDIVYATTSHCFDLSIFEMFYPLSIGKKIKILKNALNIGDELKNDCKILINTVPSSIRYILEKGISLENVSVINLAGEPFPVEIAKKLLLTKAEIRNLYGPSEDTTYSTCYKLSPENLYRTIPIGKPILDTQAFILDDELQLLPEGVIGKLYLSGAGIAKGYLNQPELTSLKFIKNPFVEGQKMYDTGDLAKWMPDGNIVFYGRKDHQVKIRGYRIELEEIENTILSFSKDIIQAIVTVKKHNNEDTLVGYYTSNELINNEHLRTYIESKLPVYMIPAYYLKIDKVPLTPNGKVDKESLPEITNFIAKQEYVAPTDFIEEKLVQIWEQTIGVAPIGVNDHFFELGGHSLMISQIINSIYKDLQKTVPYKVFYTNPTIRGVKEMLQSKAYEPIPILSDSELYPLTNSQERLWLLSQLEGGNGAYIISGAIKLKGNLNQNNFARAFNQIVSDKEILRTYFLKDDGGVLKQKVVPNDEFYFEMDMVDFSDHELPYKSVQEYIEHTEQKEYILSKSPLFNVSLLKTEKDNYIFYLSMHHLISDGWSLKVLSSLVFKYYDALQSGNLTSQTIRNIQFKDYVAWIKEEQKKDKYQRAKEFWHKQFVEDIQVLKLPGYTNRPSIKTFKGNQYNYLFSVELSEKLKMLSKNSQVTLFTTLMTGVKVLLSRYSRQDDIIIGTPVGGRDHPDLEDQIGLFINTLAIRTKIDAKATFHEILQKEGKILLEAYEYQNYPFDALVEHLNIPRDASRSPLFDIMVVLQNQHQVSLFKDALNADIEYEDFEINKNVSPFDIVFTFTEKESLHLEIVYNSDLYNSDYIQAICDHLDYLFQQVTSNSEIVLEEIEIVTEKEKEILLHKFNNTEVVYDLEKTFINYFLEQVKNTPDNIAVVSESKFLTYYELDVLSNQLANYLIQNYKITTNEYVVVKLERSEQLIFSLLGVLKTGAAYVPVDVNYPEKRIKDILEDVNPKLIIDDEFLVGFYSEKEKFNFSPNVEIKNTDLAYIIYTSGSTGKPKGVMITHQSLINLCFWHNQTYNVNALSRGTLFSGVAFDASVWEIYPYLIKGASLYPIEKEEIRLRSEFLITFLKENGITHVYLPSKICQEVMSNKNLKLNLKILTGGESLHYSKNTFLQIYNNYGPTENTVVTTYYDCKNSLNEKVSIGKPISNSKVFILSENLKLQPIGTIGELCISGLGLSKGYLNQPELTKEKFIVNPFFTKERIYRTGDLARWMPDGNLDFLGRIDNQVKIRGNRVELGEVENVIRDHNQNINDVVVLVREVNNQQHLVSYYTSEEPLDNQLLRESLKESLPDYMIPSFYIHIEKVPLTNNGKVDVAKLPIITEKNAVKRDYVAPENGIELKIVRIWQDLLGHENIGVTDDFFELGGHSLMLTKLLAEYQKTFKVSIDIKTLYVNTSLKSHVGFLQSSKNFDFLIEKASHEEYYDLSPSQMRYWLIYKIKGKSKEFNIYSTFNLPENLDLYAFETSFNILLERHEVLRSKFVSMEGIPKQKVEAFLPFHIKKFDSELAIKADVFEQEFDLEEYPLFRVGILNECSNNKLFFNIHHSICDGWSMSVISRDLMTIYNSIIYNQVLKLPELTIQYKDYAQWQNNILNSAEIKFQEKYWTEKFKGDLPYLQLPYDYTSKRKTNQSSSFYTIYLTNEQKNKISFLSEKQKVSVFAIFLAALKIVLFRLTSEKDIIVGIPVANRNHYQLKDMVGCFINTIMLRDTIDEKKSFEKWLDEVNKTLVDALANQNYPFEMLIETLKISQNDNRFPLSPVFLNMLDFENKALETITDFSSEDGLIESAPKFDFECYIKTFDNGYSIKCVFDHDLFKDETIKYWMDNYLLVLDQIIENHQISLENIKLFENYLYREEEILPLNSFEYFEENEIEQSIIQRFEKQVVMFPNRPAVYSNDTVITYKILNNCANNLAQQISQITTNKTKRVALLLNHNESSIIGMLGVLKGGFSYVPIDSNSPLDRIRFIIEDSGCELLVFNEVTAEKAQLLKKELVSLKILKLNQNYLLPEISNPSNINDPSDEAYVLYTSGSTGSPKGVIQNHRNVLHFVRVYTNNIHIALNDNLSLFSTYTFDASVKDIYGAILNGATVSIYDIVEKGLDMLSNWLFDNKITIIHMVPTIFRNFLKCLDENEVLTTVRLIDLGGESCHKIDFELFKKHFVSNALLVNDYGPTESTIVAQKFLNKNTQLTRNNIPLGKAVLETEIYLLDENNKKRGVYQEGEIVFESKYLSLGYLNRDELTNKVFSNSHLDKETRIYKSGDIGKMLPTGEIEFLQRKDSQVKINGVRIELSEIEYQLEQIGCIEEAVVLLKELKDNKYITAYIRVNQIFEHTQIKEQLSMILPKYMIPSIYITLEKFPLTRTGKIDKKSLPDPRLSDLKTTPYLAPKNEFESSLVKIWAEVLKVEIEAIGTEDNFFELGGNSLQAVVLVNKINKIYNTSFSIVNLYETLSVKKLSILVNFSIVQNSEVTSVLELEDQDEIFI